MIHVRGLKQLTGVHGKVVMQTYLLMIVLTCDTATAFLKVRFSCLWPVSSNFRQARLIEDLIHWVLWCYTEERQKQRTELVKTFMLKVVWCEGSPLSTHKKSMELRAILDGTWATKSTLTLPGKSEIKSWMAQRPILDLAKIHLTKKGRKEKRKKGDGSLVILSINLTVLMCRDIKMTLYTCLARKTCAYRFSEERLLPMYVLCESVQKNSLVSF